jgi:hypothetical protein
VNENDALVDALGAGGVDVRVGAAGGEAASDIAARIAASPTTPSTTRTFALTVRAALGRLTFRPPDRP